MMKWTKKIKSKSLQNKLLLGTSELFKYALLCIVLMMNWQKLTKRWSQKVAKKQNSLTCMFLLDFKFLLAFLVVKEKLNASKIKMTKFITFNDIFYEKQKVKTVSSFEKEKFNIRKYCFRDIGMKKLRLCFLLPSQGH